MAALPLRSSSARPFALPRPNALSPPLCRSLRRAHNARRCGRPSSASPGPIGPRLCGLWALRFGARNPSLAWWVYTGEAAEWVSAECFYPSRDPFQVFSRAALDSHPARPSHLALSALRGTLGGETMTTPGGAGAHCPTAAPRARPTGFSCRAGVSTVSLRPFTVPRIRPIFTQGVAPRDATSLCVRVHS